MPHVQTHATNTQPVNSAEVTCSSSPPRDDHETQVRHILLTGACGFVGGHVLATLLCTTPHNLSCFVRGATQQVHVDASSRLRLRVLETTGVDIQPYVMEGRVVVLEGDLARPCFDLPFHIFSSLADSVDLVINAASRVTYSPRFPTENSDSVTEVIRFAATPSRPIPIVHVSSIGARIADHPGPAQPYHRSKLEQERRLRVFAEVATDASVVVIQLGRVGPPRQPYVVGSSAPLRPNSRDLVTAFFNTSLLIVRAWPTPPHGPAFDLVPADVAADAITNLALTILGPNQPVPGITLTDLSPPSPLPYHHLHKALAANLPSLPHSDWARLLRRRVDLSDPGSDPAAAVLVRPFVELLADPAAFDMPDFTTCATPTRRLVDDTDCAYPDLDPARFVSPGAFVPSASADTQLM